MEKYFRTNHHDFNEQPWNCWNHKKKRQIRQQAPYKSKNSAPESTKNSIPSIWTFPIKRMPDNRKLFCLQSSLHIDLNELNLYFGRSGKSPSTYISHTIYLQKPDVRNWLVCTTTTNTLNMKLLSEPIYVKPSTNWVTHANSCFQQFLMRSIYPPNKLFSKLFLAPTSIQTTTVREAFITPINS